MVIFIKLNSLVSKGVEDVVVKNRQTKKPWERVLTATFFLMDKIGRNDDVSSFIHFKMHETVDC